MVLFRPCHSTNIRSKSEDERGSNGYVIDSLESSLWYFWRKKNYSGNDLGIINLEGETDAGAPKGRLTVYYFGMLAKINSKKAVLYLFQYMLLNFSQIVAIHLYK